MRHNHPISDDKPKKVKWILILLGLVLVGGIVSFILNAGSSDAEKNKEEFQFVDFAPPPPPPPPPPAPDEPEPEPEEIDDLAEPLEIPAEAEVPSDEPTNDLGIDIPEMAMGEGSGDFNIVPSFARRGGRGGSADDEDEMNPSGATEQAVPTFKSQPIFPSALLRKKIGGKVVIAAVVNASGAVVRVTIKTSSGHTELDKAAITAVQKWKFKPGTRDGKPVQSTCLIPYTFEVKNS